MTTLPPKRILLLAANPSDLALLRLGKEFKKIKQTLRGTEQREVFDVRNEGAVEPGDLQGLILDYRPQIVHFSGHGGGEKGLAFETDEGKLHAVKTEAITELFRLAANTVECVVLNACFSAVQAKAIGQHIPYVIGMGHKIGDQAATQFAVGFYRFLGDGGSYREAYDWGKNAIQLQNFKLNGKAEHLTPVLISKIEVAPTESEEGQTGSDSENDTSNVGADSTDLGDDSVATSSEAGSSEKDFPPLETPEGQVPIGSPFYVERPPIEADCYAEVLKPGSLIRIKAPRQMGKSSLMARILNHARETEHHRTVELSFQEAEGSFFSDLDTFLQWFCASITDELGLPDELDAHWKKRLGSVKNSINYVERYLLKTINTSWVLGLDEVDRVFEHPQIAKDFFGMLRVWHEKGKNPGLWQNLRLVITHSREVYIPMDINQSPFNVGMPVGLPMFTADQVKALMLVHGLQPGQNFDDLYHFLGGNPYLARVALYEMAKRKLPWDAFVAAAPIQSGPYSDHLTRHLQNIHADPALKSAMQQVMQSSKPISMRASEAFKLHSMGLVRFVGNEVEPLCNLYRQYFQKRLKNGG